MKYKLFLITFIIGTLSLSACSKERDKPNEQSSDKIVLTDKEKELFGILYSKDGEQFDEEDLLGYQLKALEQLRAAEQYLMNKYKDNTFKLTYFECADNFMNMEATLQFKDGMNDTDYEVRVEIEDDTYTCTDNYYVKFVKDPYDKYIEYLLKDSGLDTYVNTYFNTLLPMEYGADTSVDTIINLNDKVEKKCEIYVITSTPEETTTIIQDIVDKNNLYGSFSIYFVSQIDDDVALRENKGNFERISFNTFD